MPRFESDSDARRLGDALAALRRERDLSQAEAGRRAGMTSQGWGLYETGKRSGLFRPDVQRRLTTALGATPEELMLRLDPAPPATGAGQPRDGASLAGRGVASQGRAFASPPAAMATAVAARRLQLSNDDLAPWAASGVVLEYETGRWPRRDQGCVIEMNDGEMRVRIYDRADAEALVVRGGSGGLAAEERIARSDTRAVSAVTARLER
ncbi:MAG: helix-turn-helix transcriptional regulator [Brevundimonas sp.]|uniref:helix-turn-helix domain-containing protein n=1 Tax=Brevundimonas sp. TaxID=1871086 RepID=UPI0027353BC5|nr:helix-turn-helix transcriptional regulator [Brevundimonas sp.]MDP3658123.1 helix-turn-helix transcriptional regulator [Brevundimonas sp.]MDZ4111388.1 helix-turn-helix transcriptional regulator [Brevundimonas sp.]